MPAEATQAPAEAPKDQELVKAALQALPPSWGKWAPLLGALLGALLWGQARAVWEAPQQIAELRQAQEHLTTEVRDLADAFRAYVAKEAK